MELNIYEIFRYSDPDKGWGYSGFVEYYLTDKTETEEIITEWGEAVGVSEPHYEHSATPRSVDHLVNHKRELEQELERVDQALDQVSRLES